jgi:PKD repeat protein
MAASRCNDRQASFVNCKYSIVGASLAVFIVIASAQSFVLAQNEGGATPARTPMMLPTIPHIQLQPLPGYGPAPLTVGFMASSSDPEAGTFETFRWNFGDGQVSTLPPTALFHTYTIPGSYVVTLTATTTDGHQASSFAGVIVTPPAQ